MTARPRLDAAVVAFAAGLAAVAGSYAVVGDATTFVAASISNAVVRLSPAVLVTFAITVLGDVGESLATAAGLSATAAVLGVVAGAARVAARRIDRPRAAPAAVVAAVAVLALGLSGSPASAVGAAVGAGVVAAVAAGVPALNEDRDESRRTVLSAVAALAVGVAALGGRRVLEGSVIDDEESVPDDVAALLTDAEAKSLDVAGLEPLVSESFYTVDIANVDPSPDPEKWSLRLHGAVESPATFDLDDLGAMAQEHRFVTLRCVGESLNGQKCDNALWTGVPVAPLLDAVAPQGEYVMLRAFDNYFEEFPIEALRGGFLAVGMNGRPLPRAHGAPVRALIPGHWGEINVKWLTEIEVLDEPATGYWEERGWHGTGPVNTVAKLWATNRLIDGRVEVGGVAYAGTRGVERVEVSTDGGGTWTEATLSDPLPGEDVWRQWVHRYESSGSHEVVVRAVDGTGTVQPRTAASAYPNGPSGWVSRTIDP